MAMCFIRHACSEPPERYNLEAFDANTNWRIRH